MEKYLKNIKIVFLLTMAGASIVIWYAVFYYESRQDLMVTFFDIGQGDAIFIEVPGGNQVLIDGGPDDAILAKLGRTLPFWDRTIDLLVLTHPHADHLDGLIEVLKRYDADIVLETGVNHSIPEYEEWRQLLKEKDVKVVVAKSGQRIRLSDSTYLDILTPFESFEGSSPKDIHDAMVVSKLVHGLTTALLMGDAEKSLEYQLLFAGANLRGDILKVGHHGSKTSSSEDFLKIVSPRFAVISVGRKNRYGHPNQEVTDRFNSLGIKIFRTDENGDVKFWSNGKRFSKAEN